MNNIKRVIKNYLPYKYVQNKFENFIPTENNRIEPNVYNENGELKRTFFLKDTVCKHSPYTFSSVNVGETKYINWDRNNYGLPIHFYSHHEIFNKNYICEKKFGILIESEAIDKSLYDKFYLNKELIKEYDAIFTHSERLLNDFSNTYFIPGSSVWYGGTTGGGKLDEKAYLNKSKMISMVSSNKAMCDLHKYRMHLANKYQKSQIVDIMGTINGGRPVKISDSLEDYCYSIIIENKITSCYFTEKLLNCFASMTVPIYIGATNIQRYFNIDGIIQINPYEDEEKLDMILKSCSYNDYNARKDAIIDNYNRVKEYMCIEDYIYCHYESKFD